MKSVRHIGRRRTGMVVLGTTLVSLALAGCIPAPSPGSFPNPPPVVTVTVSDPAPVAGQQITLRVEATHTVGITAITTRLTRADIELPAVYGCSDAAQVVSGTATDRIVTIDCTMPADAPSGLWKFTAETSAVDAMVVSKKVQFVLSGPSTDTYGPRVVDFDTTPDLVTAHGQVTFTAHVRDDHGPVTMNIADLEHSIAPLEDCFANPVDDGSVAPITYFSFTCTLNYNFTPPGPGIRELVDVWFYDKFGFYTHFGDWTFSVIDG